MRVIDPGRKQISNAEVAVHVKSLAEKYENNARRASHGSQPVPENVTRALSDVIDGLSNQLSQHPPRSQPEQQPSSSTSSQAASSRSLGPNFVLRKTSALAAELRAPPYKLLGSEIVQIVNGRPKDLLELAVFVEEADMRFSEEELEGILKLVADSLNEGPGVNGVNGANGVSGVNGSRKASGTDAS